MKIILGTASKQRREVFEEMGYDFTVMSADINEKEIRSRNPEELTVALAKAKAAELLKRITEPAILITADQVIGRGGEIREKPKDADQAREYLRTCHEVPVRIVNGIAVTNTQTGAQAAENDTALVTFRQIPEEIVERLVGEGRVFSWAGAFATKDPLIAPYVASMDGADGSSRGLPKALVSRLMQEVQTAE
ncbi:MAG: Maf family protein [Candidatus Wildermuthbacteria bacterium]|nr:Maf family protein [Candidatus Wildermuthbacteria bacterium]